MALTLTQNHHLRRDGAGTLRTIRHNQAPFLPSGQSGLSPQRLGNDYLAEVAGHYGLAADALSSLSERPGQVHQAGEGNRLRLEREKRALASRVLVYRQTFEAIPVFQAGLSVVLDDSPRAVISSTSTFEDIKSISIPGDGMVHVPTSRRWQTSLVGALAKRNKARVVDIHGAKAWVYRYDPKRREHLLHVVDDDGKEREVRIATLPALPRQICAGAHYLCTELRFTLAIGPWKGLHFGAMVEASTGAILALVPGVDGVDGMVYPADPQSLSGDASITPCSPATDLDPLRISTELLGLTPPAPGADQTLTGEYVTIGEHALPNIAGPSESVGSDFAYSATTNDFAAVQGYYTVDAMFRYIEALGFDLGTYFNNTTFPVTVDVRDASQGMVNAVAYGNANGDGSDGFGFNLCDADCSVGITADLRIAWHEMSHALLWEHVGGGRLGFAHSCGDALGTILSDAIAQGLDRFDTFAFNVIDSPFERRHDRDVADGWAWGGPKDDSFYFSEQILATTMFRFYNSTNGDSNSPADRRLAADHAAFLIIGAVSMLSSVNPAWDPDDFATGLIDFDKGNDYLGYSRGALHKVIRWAFEKQGLYEGAAPDVDVYIDDGRGGEYPYQRNFWNSQEIWSRLTDDSGVDHQPPLLDVPNFMYVRVRNRGSQLAESIHVKAFHCRPGTGLVWPDDWQSMTTAELTPAGSIASGGSMVVGPFEWTPTEEGHECLLAIASADGDPGNDTTVTGSIPHSRFVPFDNNIGQRNVAPIPGGGAGAAVGAAFDMRSFWFNNPFDWSVEGRIEVELPAFLRRRGYKLRFTSPGGDRFSLGPRGSRKVVMALDAPSDFAPSEVKAEDRSIEVIARIDDRVVGGMTYLIDPKLKAPASERPCVGGSGRDTESKSTTCGCDLGSCWRCLRGWLVKYGGGR